MSVRFLHTADLHLGSPLRTIGAESEALQETLRDATYEAFARIVDIAIDESVDFVVIAGDLYDQESRSVRANQFAVEQFERIGERGIPCYLTYGNHDPLGSRSELLDLPDNVHVFDHEEVEIVDYPLEGPTEARIIGHSYRSSSDSRSMYEQFTPPDQSIPNIGVLHTGLDPDAGKYAPCSETDLRGKEGIHYWALGHIHHPRIYHGTPTLAYPGIPQSRDVTEPAVGGCYIVEVETNREPQLEFVSTSPVIWQVRTVNIEEGDDDVENVSDIEELLSSDAEAIQTTPEDEHIPDLGVEALETEWKPEGFVCRWELHGRGPIHEIFQEEDEIEIFIAERLRRKFGRVTPFIWTESVKNRLGPPLPDLDYLRENDPVIGEFYNIVEEPGDDLNVRQEIREEAGEIWFEPEDPEDDRETHLPLTEEKLDELIERAEARVIEELIERREYVDS